MMKFYLIYIMPILVISATCFTDILRRLGKLIKIVLLMDRGHFHLFEEEV